MLFSITVYVVKFMFCRYFTESVLETLWKEIAKDGTMNSITETLVQEHSCRDKEMELFELSNKYSKEVNTKENQIKQLLIKSCEQINKKEIQLAILQVTFENSHTFKKHF